MRDTEKHTRRGSEHNVSGRFVLICDGVPLLDMAHRERLLEVKSPDVREPHMSFCA
jgi:hypothetical protein